MRSFLFVSDQNGFNQLIRLPSIVVMVPPVPVAPMPVMPVMAMPVTMMPMTVMPVHLHRLHLIDFVLGNDGRVDADRRRHARRKSRRHGRSLCAYSQQDRARNQSGTEIEEMPEFHEFKPLSRDETEKTCSLVGQT
ncbi:MAG TPA: hypothetical protein VFL62_26130 [Bradyrhizobium sp.]|uniref:hypothetical protein n=1 Tax=Bradyrhizobium sp. TaxID=376 RepID=UPI002D800D7D|nr:hypothetical protein [Bradyrhizobium sp.]HET7889725.1 hypothetical protein [Bradyrhizobium sp.]